MHGMVLAEFKKYVDINSSNGAWNKILSKAGMDSKTILLSKEYQDDEIIALVRAASQITGRSSSDLLMDFGEFMAVRLLNMYSIMIKPEWKTLDLIEHTEAKIHTLVRTRTPGTKPPILKCSRPSKDEVIITYNSSRKMCDFAKGIARGLATHYNENIHITESTCMNHGSPSCSISIKLEK